MNELDAVRILHETFPDKYVTVGKEIGIFKDGDTRYSYNGYVEGIGAETQFDSLEDVVDVFIRSTILARTFKTNFIINKKPSEFQYALDKVL